MGYDIKKELGQNFIEYAVAVNSDRAIPDAKCGLKPVARRILYEAYVGKYNSTKAHEKCAKLVGDVMGNLHPHGDSSIYEAMVHISRPWVMRYPLMDFYGNMGNIGGDDAAAYRYTNIRLAKISEEGMLMGLNKRNVDFVPDYDEKDEEPVTLPAIFPNLLCNPNVGIGVAMASGWLPHNLNEVAQAINDYIDGKEPTLPGPDFPTGGLIINGDELPKFISSGHGTVRVRGKYKLEKHCIVFTEVPYGIKLEALMKQVGDLCDAEELEGVEEIRNESNKNGLRIVIECDKKANIGKIINKIFQKTDFETTISYNQVALIDKVPTELGLKDAIKVYVDHNKNCIRREAEYDLEKTKARKEVIEGLLIALEDIDNVITLIRKSDSAATAKDELMKKYSISEVQAKAIVDMKLGRLANLEKIELLTEKKEIEENFKALNALAQSDEAQEDELKKRLQTIVKNFGDDRRTEITNIEIVKEKKEKIEVEPEKVVVVLTEDGAVKRIPATAFKTQNRNSKGVKSQSDIVKATIRTNTVDSLLVFSNLGRVYRVPVSDIPVGNNTSVGQLITTLIQMENNEVPCLIYSVYKDTDTKFVLFATKNGLVKKTPLAEFSSLRKKGGAIAIKLQEGDSLASVTLLNDEDIILITSGGMGIRFLAKNITPTGKTSIGVKGITLKENDYVVAAIALRDTNDDLAIFSENGLGKRIKNSEISAQGRGGKGLIIYKTSAASGLLTAASMINEEDNILINGNPNSLCIAGKDIPLLGRTSIGNILIKGSKISSVSKI